MSGGLRVAITGASGRMGGELLAAAADRDDVEFVLAATQSPGAFPSGDVPAADTVVDDTELDGALAEHDVDVLVDFTVPGASVEYLRTAAANDVAVVVGTTGYSELQRTELGEVAEAVPFLKASNFSRGVAALRRAVREAVAALPGYDIELTETHHNGKRDAPSGTALSILDDVDEVRGADAERVNGRVGEQPREGDEIGVHARRAGDVTGEHEVLLAGNDEVLELTHRAGSRGIFAAGALDAAAWLAGRDAGRYDFDEVLDADSDESDTGAH
ncbi:4-hydroxy-tetrahydrodipicolinate reductase [Halobellus sp. Atlit-38R]|jgi:4-hydroxy-tetrahydrodipicolinate reductase|uniref:4-hydroxy-tetrahydrodipicolinate reductase n=1 Tax=Halobellus sp. Atlit-38R TaxID=2282131 RepID=UPI000EF20C22|nr:4-hydroxy-tetrahydrodipicolinate reductase [Halobellus sp. Atlit-38R]RLM94647.1 4-hydroxy-tetrahydrodipicolinate reductase [Halobellus sp. Atlit-38R]